MGKPKKIERLKDFLLVVLFFSTMLLLYFLWENPAETFTLPDIISEEEENIAPAIREVTKPVETVVNFGGGVYTVLNDVNSNAWNLCIQTIAGYAQDEEPAIEEITQEQYKRIMEFRSIRFEYSYSLPFDSFCRKYSINSILNNSQQIKSFTVIGYSAASPESLFVCDEKNNKYYRMISDSAKTALEDLIYRIETGNYINYYPIGTVVGTGNRTVVPLLMETDLANIRIDSEFDTSDTERIREFAQTFFGDSFDFVRRIEESKGTVIFMYGYGQKILTINADGSVEYKEKINTSGTQQDYFDALEAVLQFVASHGGWDPFEGSEIRPYVRFASAIEREKKTGYRFIFGMELNGERVYYENSEAIVAEIINGQVTYYTRNMFIPEPGNQMQRQPEKEAYSAVNMIAQNYHFMQSAMLNEGYQFEDTDNEGLFEAVSNLIKHVEKGYVRPMQNDGNELIPAWIVTADGIIMYFDLYNAEPLGYNIINLT